jgi:hypothetical protein
VAEVVEVDVVADVSHEAPDKCRGIPRTDKGVGETVQEPGRLRVVGVRSGHGGILPEKGWKCG